MPCFYSNTTASDPTLPCVCWSVAWASLESSPSSRWSCRVFHSWWMLTTMATVFWPLSNNCSVASFPLDGAWCTNIGRATCGPFMRPPDVSSTCRPCRPRQAWCVCYSVKCPPWLWRGGPGPRIKQCWVWLVPPAWPFRWATTSTKKPSWTCSCPCSCGMFVPN